MKKEYRVVGKHGQWGEIYWDLEDAEEDRKYAEKAHRHQFHIEVREVTDWKEVQ